MNGIYHGECVAIGMTVVCGDEVKSRLIPVLRKLGLPTKYEGDLERALKHIAHDKKCDGALVDIVRVDRVGECAVQKMSINDFASTVRARHGSL